MSSLRIKDIILIVVVLIGAKFLVNYEISISIEQFLNLNVANLGLVNFYLSYLIPCMPIVFLMDCIDSLKLQKN